jgi:hypothetical protein
VEAQRIVEGLCGFWRIHPGGIAFPRQEQETDEVRILQAEPILNKL